jgi:thiol-disulfide isomerase/thioredoxin
MKNITKKSFAAFCIATVFLSGCSKTAEEVVTTVNAPKTAENIEATTDELKILENLPTGVMAYAIRATSGLFSKAEQIVTLKEYLPEHMKMALNENIPEIYHSEIVNAYWGGLNISMLAIPKTQNTENGVVDWEKFFALMNEKDDEKTAEYLLEVVNTNLCVAGKGAVEMSRVKDLLQKSLDNEEMRAKLSEEDIAEMTALTNGDEEKTKEFFEMMQKEIQDAKEGKGDGAENQEFLLASNFTLSYDDEFVMIDMYSNACTQEDKTLMKNFADQVNHQDRMSEFFSFDKAFLQSFLSEKEIDMLKKNIPEKKAEFFAAFEEKGMKKETIEKIFAEIVDPLQKLPFFHQFRDFEKYAIVWGEIKGNFADRESESVLQFSDEKTAALMAEIKTGQIAQKKLWINEETDFVSTVSYNQKTGNIYQYEQYKDAEYPSYINDTNFFITGYLLAVFGVAGFEIAKNSTDNFGNYEGGSIETSSDFFTDDEGYFIGDPDPSSYSQLPQNREEKLAQCLSEKKVVVYGTPTCPHCVQQKELFGESAKPFLPFVDCDANADRCEKEGITGIPTWKFADGTELSGTQKLETLAKKSGCEY